MFRRVLDVLWSEWFWLPPNVTWNDISNGPNKKYVYAELNDVWYQIPLTLLLLILRLETEKYIFVPLGKSLGVPDKKLRKIPKNPVLEAAYKSSQKLTNPNGLAKQTDMSQREVERWWRLRRNQNKTSKLTKFCETSWKATFLFSSVIFGFYNVLDKDWFWDVEKIFIYYPHRSYTAAEWWYYMLSTSFYWSLLVTHFNDVRHKDFWLMLTHHILTIVLLVSAWTLNLYRLGMMILPLQDSAEALLMLTKSIHYVDLNFFTYASFISFFVWWFVERLYIFPVDFVWVVFYSFEKHCSMYPAAMLGLGILCLLLVLHIWWSWLLIVTTYNLLAKEKYQDVRSSESEASGSDQKEYVNETE